MSRRRSPAMPVLLPPVPPLRSFFTNTRWGVICAGVHTFTRIGWPFVTWTNRLSLTGSLMNKERRA